MFLCCTLEFGCHPVSKDPTHLAAFVTRFPVASCSHVLGHGRCVGSQQILYT